MLQTIRDHTHGWAANVIIALLILSFALWGIHSYISSDGNNTTVATVNHISITKQQLEIAYERLRRQSSMANNINNKIDEARFKKNALQKLIHSQVFLQSAISQGYRISPLQVENFLVSMPQFQENGQFSMARFQQGLAVTGYSSSEFFDVIKAMLMVDQPRLGIIFTSFALPNEVNNTIALVNEKRNMAYLVIPYEAIHKASIQLSESAIKHYYQEHEKEFRTPEQVSLEYIELAIPVKNNANNSNSKQLSAEQFFNLKEKLANITYEYPDTLEPAAKALGLEIKTTGFFAQQQANAIKSKSTKTHLLVSDTDLIMNTPAVRQLAFRSDTLTTNNSDVIPITPDKVIVFRVKKRIPAMLLAFEKVRPDIIAKLQAVEINRRTRQLADEIKNRFERQEALVNMNMNMNMNIKEYPYHWIKTGWIGRHARGVDSALLDTVFSMPKPLINRIRYAVTQLPEGYGIVALKGIEPGVVTNGEEDRVFAEQIQNSKGLTEYALYKKSLMGKAKIIIAK